MCTIVTAFFDINRNTKGDGRTIEEYKIWIKNTLELNCNLFIVTEPKFENFIRTNRPDILLSKTYINIINLTDSYYYKYYNEINQIINSTNYKQIIQNPDRIECILPEYNIIQYSKFYYLQLAIKLNPFNTKYFMWADIGISRFFLDVDINQEYPTTKGLQILDQSNNKLIIQNRADIHTFNIDNNFIWRSDNLLIGTMFGGTAEIINIIAELIENLFINLIYNYKCVNNEQIALALVYINNKDLFYLINNNTNYHLILFKLLSHI
jgi:hypothetical protein